jgi:methyl coenzyme M reductase subunit D
MGDRQPRRKTHARPARKTGGDSGEVKMKMKIMKWRVIITIELNKQRKSSLRQQIKKELAKCGINRQRGKNTWEGQAITAADAVQKMSTVLSYLADPKKISNPKRAQFDHLWVYVDRVETEVA